ncbi:L-seryl-tRNA(Sec) kinase [Onthophagus taurus]|uniref:L-seryl-tRNA(Sec) kinase n=1 Tax=Onthophagus taurus TaxID=166361 RepID=UPI0039BE4EB4
MCVDKTNCLIVCIGLPGAGKTTFCKKLKEIWLDYEIIHINYDEIIGSNYSSDKRKEILNDVHQLISNLQSNKTLILIDDNMYYKSMRYEYLQLARRHSISFLQLYFEVTLNVALKRNEVRTNPVPDEIIKEMNHKMEVPHQDFYFIPESFQFTAKELSDLKDVIDKSFNNPMCNTKYIPKIQHNINESKFHRIDLILRKIVSTKIKYDQKNSLNYVKTRKDVLKKIKNGEYCELENLDEENIEKVLSKLF